jgi:hypothetical protein
MENGISGKLCLQTLEDAIIKTVLDKNWTKGAVAFMTHIGHLLSDHFKLRDATVYSDQWYITKLNSSFNYHPEMRAHISTLEAQHAEISRSLSAAMHGAATPAPTTYQEHYDKLLAHATVIDFTALEIKVDLSNRK